MTLAARLQSTTLQLWMVPNLSLYHRARCFLARSFPCPGIPSYVSMPLVTSDAQPPSPRLD